MKKTSIYFNDKGLVKDTSVVQDSKNTGSEHDKDILEERPRPYRLDIDFEPPRDFDKEPPKDTLKVRIENLERKQTEILQVLHQLFARIPKFPGYLTIEEALKKYETDRRTIRQHIKLFQRVKNRPVEIKEFNTDKLYKEDDLVQALLLNWDIEINRLQKHDLTEY